MYLLRLFPLLFLPHLAIPTPLPPRQHTYDPYTITCNASATLPTPSYGTTGGIFTICATAVISAPLASIYTAILSFRTYAAWNSFVTSVTLPANVTSAEEVYVGMDMTLYTAGVLDGATTSSKEFVTVLDPEQGAGVKSAAWAFNDTVGGAFQRAEHVSLLREVGGGRVEYVSWETYYGPGALVVGGLLKGRLQSGFERQGLDLKRWVESGGGN